jgi:hypothetical protein
MTIQRPTRDGPAQDRLVRDPRAEIAQHVEAAKGGLRFARRGASVTFAHPFQPIRQVEQFLLDLRDLRLSCQLPDLLCNSAIIFTASFPLVAHRRILDRKRFPEEAGASVPLPIGTLEKAVGLTNLG